MLFDQNFNDDFKLGEESPLDQKMTYRLKLQFCKKFSEKYLIVLFFLFLIILLKRLIIESMPSKDFSRIIFHLIVIALSLLALRFQRT